MWNQSISCGLLLFAVCFLPAAYSHPKVDFNPDDTWDSINEGWIEPYSLLMPHLKPGRNYVAWTIIAPKVPIDLRQPDDFRQFITSLTSKKSLSISHNLVAWNCQLPNGQFYSGATGHSGEISGQSKKMVKAGYGLTTFMSTFTDGWLSGAFHTGGIFEERSKNEETYSLVVEVSSQDCANMLGFLKKFIYHPKTPVQNFGLTLNPEKFEGAGCISFASTLMKKAGVLSQFFDHALRSLWASPYRFGGNDLEIPENTIVPRVSWLEGRKKKVSLIEFLQPNWNATVKGVNIELLDPELLVWGLKSLSPRLQKSPRQVFVPGRECRRGDPVSCGGSYRKVDDNYDSQAARVAKDARQWKSKKLAEGYEMTEVLIMDEPFLIFSKR